MDIHLEVYVVVLNIRRSKSPKYYKSCDAGYEQLLAHISPTIVQAADIILMLVHLLDHWALLTCNLKEEMWYFYDFMPYPMHHSTLSSLQDISKSLPTWLHSWDIKTVGEAPTQESGNDCGIFVLKYMKVIGITKSISWSSFKSWQKNAAKFRAEIAVEMIELFCSKT
ncbi:hypothetical protein KSP40_PGU013181 [Platanthera guangdongensis]|uniref:Ubiquitin-like protease family profile domain-containing protein n=1 Tax=Platanthera guangdongensis TaxID=2320717 RepID=A0ABR2LEB2_9ASPA